MITRIQIDGFKNLRKVDLSFGAFTCIAGPNGSGKSNLFDAIQFLSLTASKTVLEAALSIRADGVLPSAPEHIFDCSEPVGHRQIYFRVEMIVPATALDDLNQEAAATFTFLVYELSIRERDRTPMSGPLEIVREQLSNLSWSQAKEQLGFQHGNKWRESLRQRGTSTGSKVFISTKLSDGTTIIARHQDGGSRGQPVPALATNLPRTVLSIANASESPTVLCAKREMESWRLLALEASSLRSPDNFNDEGKLLDAHGRHMPATLHRLMESQPDPTQVSARIASRLTELVENIRGIQLVEDEVRQAYSILVTERSGRPIPARGLSDGTLRFLALAILEEDPLIEGIICLEEPENGIHPRRLPAMIRLLKDIALDPTLACGDDNPLRQVIINTHSPTVVAEVPDDSLIIVEEQPMRLGGSTRQIPCFLGLPDTWRSRRTGQSIPKGALLAYLNPIQKAPSHGKKALRVVDRQDLQMKLPGVE